MKRSVFVESEAVFVKNAIGTNLLEESFEKSNVPFIFHSASIDAIRHEILKSVNEKSVIP
jgi:hypothetical protein